MHTDLIKGRGDYGRIPDESYLKNVIFCYQPQNRAIYRESMPDYEHFKKNYIKIGAEMSELGASEKYASRAHGARNRLLWATFSGP